MFVPLLLVEYRIKDIATHLSKARNEIHRIEKLIGTYRNYYRIEAERKMGFHSHGEEVWKRPGFEEAPGELTSVTSECLVWQSKCEMNLKLLEWIEGTNSRIGKLYPNAEGRDVDFATKIEFMKTGLENNLILCTYIVHRAEVQIQAVSRCTVYDRVG